MVMQAAKWACITWHVLYGIYYMVYIMWHILYGIYYMACITWHVLLYVSSSIFHLQLLYLYTNMLCQYLPPQMTKYWITVCTFLSSLIKAIQYKLPHHDIIWNAQWAFKPNQTVWKSFRFKREEKKLEKKVKLISFDVDPYSAISSFSRSQNYFSCI